MDIQQPTIETPLPSDLQVKIDQARNNLTILQADIAQSGRVKLINEKEIITLNSSIAYLKGQIKSLEEQRLALVAAIDGLVVEKNNLMAENDERIKAHQANVEKLQHDIEKNNIWSKSLDGLAHGLELVKKAQEAHEVDLANREQAIVNKAAKIKEISQLL